MTGALGRFVYAARATRAIAAQPYEGFERVFERIAEWHVHRRPPPRYEVTEPCEEQVHELVGARWPCRESAKGDEVWHAVMQELLDRGLAVGRGAFGGWDDGDIRIGRLAWCLARHLRPRRIVETGVGRGLVSRLLLEAIERNGIGELWSIDLPPLLERDLAQQTAAAVPERLHPRWTLLRGSSRRLLPSLVRDLGTIEMFVHDSLHTTRNLRRELDQIWPALRLGGVALIDDVEKNSATADFLLRHPEVEAVICPSEDGQVLIGCLLKRAARASNLTTRTTPGARACRRDDVVRAQPLRRSRLAPAGSQMAQAPPRSGLGEGCCGLSRVVQVNLNLDCFRR
jgi:predicted O-methyltransferase YrrM